jgi:hypothetical protein
MKKNIYLLVMCILGINILNAKPITPASAKSVAISFYKQQTQKENIITTLAYTETSSTGDPVYYVFNINTQDGFVIVAADDAAHPIIGYSDERQFVIPTNAAHVGISSWLQRRKDEIVSLRAENLQANEEITNEWKGVFVGTNSTYRNGNPTTATTMSVAPLVQTTWDQPSPYNAKCPSNCLTGCVATAMSQIMRFWSYPTQGASSSSYSAGTYGTLSATYSTTTYNWSNMPTGSVSSSGNADVALIMSHAGISVQMTYGTSESSAYVISADNAVCAQASYTKYFKYDPTSIQGLKATAYSSTAWATLLEADLNNGMPVEYAGQDPNNGGHTWVCDGYNASTQFHMNWGWSGSDNGYYAISSLNPGGSFNFSQGHEAVTGIKPLVSIKDDAGIASIVSPSGKSCSSSVIPVVSIKNYGSAALTSCTISYNVDNGTNQTYNWTGSLATGASANVTLPAITAAAGTHTLTSSTSNPDGTTDGNTANDQSTQPFTITTPVIGNLPVAEGFESSGTALPSGWTINNPDNDAAWAISTTVAHTGSNSIGFNNCNGDGSSTDMTGRKDWFYTTGYDFSSVSTASLSFDVGYVPANDGTTLYTDSLVVLSSTDCGTTWNQIYKKGGMTLATAPAFTITSTVNCTTPTSSQWRTDVVNVASLAGSSNVMFAFENISDYGNWVFLDNINISSTSTTTGISSKNSDEKISLYPNPAHTSLYVNVTENTSSLSVTDLIGHTVVSEQRVDGSQQVQSIDISNLSDGIYFMRVNSTNNQAQIIRFIKN